MRLILASGSKSRRDIFDMLGLDYEVVTSKVEENSSKTDPAEYVKELSLAKAQSVADQIEGDALIVSADTILFKDGKFYEKPKTKEEAAKNIKDLMGEKFQSFTGVTIFDKHQIKTVSYAASVDIEFRDNITDEEIEWYTENEPNVLKCCGFTPQGKGAIFFEGLYGDYNVLFGISPSMLVQEFAELGYKLSDFKLK